jgi:molybdate transport system substrate-binding protein
MGRRIRILGTLVVSLVVVAGMAACSSPSSRPTPSASATAKLTGSITVYGAASLQPTFTTLATDFEVLHPGTTVQSTFNGSGVLETQIVQGAPADVFASADTAPMQALQQAGFVEGKPIDFATNTLEIAVPKGNPAHIKTFADLAKPGLKVVVCALSQPCGAATAQMEQLTGVKLAPVSEELSVTDVLTQVSTGQADAGLVYVTDVKSAGPTVEGVPFEQSGKVVNTYPIAALKHSSDPALARAFVSYVTGPAGEAVLKVAGFGKP